MLTEADIRALQSSSKDQLIPAGGRDGLYLRLRTTGRKTWVVRRRVDGKWRVFTLGDWPRVTAKAARGTAATSNTPAAAITFKAAADDFCREVIEASYKAAPARTSAYLLRDCKSLHARRLDRIRSGDLVALIRSKSSASPAAAVKLLSVLKRFFAWAKLGELIASNPTDGLTSKVLHLRSYEPRRRILLDEEIRLLWGFPDEPHGQMLRFCLLTGCRIGEALNLRPEQIVDGIWTIPVTKNGRPHPLPLAPLALRMAEAGWPRRSYEAVYAFLLLRNVTWRPHDLRRTCATRMRDAGVSIEVIEAVLNHAPPKLIRTYQLPDLMPAMRQALVKLEHAVLEVVKPAN